MGVTTKRMKLRGRGHAGQPMVRPRRVAWAAWLGLWLLVGGWFAPGVSAWPIFQDGTDPARDACLVPEAAAATPGVASPVALPTATPAASPQAIPATADPVIAAQVEAVVRALAACLTAGRPDVVAELVTERYLGQMYGGGDRMSRDEFLALARTLPAIPLTILAVTDVRLDGPREASVTVESVLGNQLQRGIWTLTRGSSRARWRVDHVEALALQRPAGASQINVRIEDYAFSLSTRRVQVPDIVLAGTNRGKEDHELLVLRLAAGVSTDILLTEAGPGFPPGVTFVGQITVPAGESAELILVGLRPGSYALVCLLPDADGVPHLALGMKTRFTVER